MSAISVQRKGTARCLRLPGDDLCLGENNVKHRLKIDEASKSNQIKQLLKDF